MLLKEQYSRMRTFKDRHNCRTPKFEPLHELRQLRKKTQPPHQESQGQWQDLLQPKYPPPPSQQMHSYQSTYQHQGTTFQHPLRGFLRQPLSPRHQPSIKSYIKSRPPMTASSYKATYKTTTLFPFNNISLLNLSKSLQHPRHLLLCPP